MAAEAMLEYEFSKVLDFIQSYGSIYFVTPFDNRSKVTLIGFCAMWFLVFLTCIQLLLTLFFTGFSDLMGIIEIAPNIGTALMSAIMYMKFHTNRKIYSKILDHYRGDFWNLLPEHSEDNFKILSKNLKIMHVINTSLIIFTAILIIIVDSFPWLVMTYEEKILKKNVQPLYPFDAWYPFDKVKWYSIAYIWESMMTAIVVGLYSLGNCVHFSYIIYICTELKLIGCWLEGLISPGNITYTKDRKELKRHKRIHMKFNMIAKRYNFLYEYVLEILSHNF